MSNTAFRSVLLSVLVVAASLHAQERVEGLAIGSPKGILVQLGLEIVSRDRPADGVTAYRLERRSVGETEWAVIAEVEAPASRAEFERRLAQAYPVFPGQERLAEDVVNELWNRVQANPSFDTLGMWAGAMVVRLALGAMYLDDGAEQGVEYQYRVSGLTEAGEAVPMLESGKPGKSHWPLEVEFSPVGLVSRLVDDSSVTLRWRAVGESLGCYMLVYRRALGQGAFTAFPVSRLVTRSGDTVDYVMEDTMVEARMLYEYYMRPMCSYGNMGAPSETTTVATYRFVDLPLPRRLRTESMDSLPGVRLSWSIDASELVKSIRIFRSTEFDTGYALLAEIAPSDTVYVDATAREMVKYFYYLDMTGFMDEVSGKTPRLHGIYQSTLTPLPPYRLEARGFDRGVRLSWRWVGDEPEGFYVYRCPGIDDTLVQVSGLVPVSGEVVEFVDSSASLSPYTTYGYGISAESKSHVRSPIAETAYARPDLPTEPREPSDLNAQAAEGRVSLYWPDMRPASRGLVGYHVSRRILPEGGEPSEWERLTESPVPVEVNSYVDSAVEVGVRYEYTVQSIDAFGGESPTSVPVRITVGQAGIVPPAGLSAVVNGDAVTVGWDETAQDSIAGYRLYRYERGGGVELVAELDPRATSYEDGSVARDRLYFYHVTCFDSLGRESVPSEEVSIRLE